MHLRYLRLYLLIGLVPIVIIGAANYLIDPYQIFQTNLLPEVGATQERYLKIELLKHQQVFDTFLLGGSRMGTTNPSDIEKILPGTRVYNLFVSSGNQTDNYLNGRWLLKTQPQIKNIFVQVDWPESIGSFQGNYQYISHPEVKRESAAGFKLQYLFFLSYEAFDFKIKNNTVRRGEYKLPLQSGQFYYPARDVQLARDCPSYVKNSPSLSSSVLEEGPSLERRALIERSLETLALLVAAARERGVRIELYVTPYNRHFLDRLNSDEYTYFLNGLAKIAPFWNFGFYSELTLNDCNYYESSHYVGSVAPRLYRVMSGGNRFPYARRVTRDNVVDELEFVRENFREHRQVATR